jgi:glycosyltransferase involved in cell wall biosynthesis
MTHRIFQKGISIVIPSIGRPSLEKLLESIHSDVSLNKHEILIVVHSKLIPELNNQYKKYKCIKFVVQNDENISKSRNRGIATARNEIISLIDDDDLWVGDRVKNLSKLLQNSSKLIVFGSVKLINTQFSSKKIKGKRQKVDLRNYIKQFSTLPIAKEKYFLHVGSCAFLAQNRPPTFNENLSYLEDQIWILKSLIQGFTVLQISDVTLEYHFSRHRSNFRWNIATEKQIYNTLKETDICLSKKYINRKSLKSLALSGDKPKFREARSAIQQNFDSYIVNNRSILFFTLLVNLMWLIESNKLLKKR